MPIDHHVPTAAEIERRQSQAERASRQRRTMQRAVKDFREKITSSSGLNRAFEIELAGLFARNHVGALVALVPFAVVLALTTLSWTSPARALAWFGLASLAFAGQFAICRAFLNAERDEKTIRMWIRRLILSEISVVFVWCLLPFIVGIPHVEGWRLFLLFSMLIIGAVSAVLSHPLPSAAYGVVLPIAMVIVSLTFADSPAERWMITSLAFTALLLFVILANRLYVTTLDSLMARAEKDDLFAEVEQANMRLKEATKRAEDASAAKSKFLATMSHELRTPLNAILGFSEVIKGEMFGPLNNEQYKSYIGDIHSSGQHLLTLINEVLDLSRIEAGKHELAEEGIELAETVMACVHMLELRAKNRGLIVRTAFTEGMPRLWADERAIRQIALNLLSNAVKFTTQGSVITVKAGWTRGGGQYLSVSDNGPGIPEEEIAIVLSTFGRGSMALKNADPGSGLGLPIVKSLVELHGGSFVLRSRLREGTEAIAMFPPSRVMQAIPAVETAAPTQDSPRNRAA